MALTATATQGFEPVGKTSSETIFFLPGNPGTTYTRGDIVGIGGAVSEASPTAGLEGVLKQLATADVNPLGTVVKTTVCPAASQPFPKPSELDPIYWNAEDKCLVPVRVHVPEGVQIYNATFANHVDDTVAAYASGTRSIQATASYTADNYPNGALIYVYEGPGAGEVNVVEDYDHAGGVYAQELITHRAFATDLTTSSKYIAISGEAAAARGISLFGRIDAADKDNLTANNGANDGEWVVFCDWYKIGTHLKNLRLPVIPRRVIYGA